MPLKNINFGFLIERILLWLAITILTAIFVLGSSTIRGSRDGTKALKEVEKQDCRLKSLEKQSSIHDIHLNRIMKDVDEIKKSNEKMMAYIIAIYRNEK